MKNSFLKNSIIKKYLTNSNIFHLLILLFTICIILIITNPKMNNNIYSVNNENDENDENNIYEGFSNKIKEFMNRNKQKDYKEGTQLDKVIDGLKNLDNGNLKVQNSIFSKLYQSTDDKSINNKDNNSDNNSNSESNKNSDGKFDNRFSINKKIKYDKNGNNVSSSKMKSSIQEYYNKFNDKRFTEECDTTYKSLKKFKHFKDEFYNLFKEF